MEKYKNSKVTHSLILICIAVYVISTLLYGLTMSAYDAIEFLGYNPLLVAIEHDYYRFITSNFIHFGIFHIVVNCYSLYNIGTFVEGILGVKDYSFVVVCSMISTTLLPYLLFLINGFGYNSVSGGISGVICGLLGCIVAFALVVKGEFQEVLKSLMPSIILMLVMSISLSDISLSGHLSGMSGGFVSSYLLLKYRTKKRIIN